MAALLRHAPPWTQLRVLDLSKNNLPGGAAARLALEAAGRWPQLVELNLSEDDEDDEG